MVTCDLDCVVLAAGKGSRMLDLTGGAPKCMLTLAGHPLLYYSLKLLEANGFKSAIVTVPDSIKTEVQKFGEKYKLDLKLDVVGIPMQEEWGTLDTLRFIQDKLVSRDVMLLSVDLVTNFNLKKLVDFHRGKGAALSVLLNRPVTQDLKSRITPGSKTNKYKLERDLIGLSSSSDSICLFQAEADVEERIHMPVRLLRTQPRFTIHSNLLDTHLYIIHRKVLDDHLSNKGMTTVKGELIPKLVAAQFKSEKKSENEDLESRLSYSLEDTNTRLNCHAVLTDLPTLRVNNIPNYWEAFNMVKEGALASQAVSSLSETSDESSASVDPKCHADKTTFGARTSVAAKTTLKSSAVGAGCTVHEKVKIVNCVLMDNVTVCSNVSLADTIVCEGAVVKGGSEVSLCVVGKRYTVAEGSSLANQVLLDSDSMMHI